MADQTQSVDNGPSLLTVTVVDRLRDPTSREIEAALRAFANAEDGSSVRYRVRLAINAFLEKRRAR